MFSCDLQSCKDLFSFTVLLIWYTEWFKNNNTKLKQFYLKQKSSMFIALQMKFLKMLKMLDIKAICNKRLWKPCLNNFVSSFVCFNKCFLFFVLKCWYKFTGTKSILVTTILASITNQTKITDLYIPLFLTADV